jgi:hypothetical protein
VDNVWEQRKLEATLREMLENAAQHSMHWTLCWTAVYIRGLIIRGISWHFAWAIILSSEKGYKSLTAHSTDQQPFLAVAGQLLGPMRNKG